MLRIIKRIILMLILMANMINLTIAKEVIMVLKINPIKGEKFVTKLTNPYSIQSIFKNGLEAKGFKVYTNSKEILEDNIDEKELYFADVFVYQYPAQYPSVSIIIRKNEGVIYMNDKYIKLFGDRQKANEDISMQLVSDVPSIKLIREYQIIKSYDFLTSNRKSLIGSVSNSVMDLYSKKYEVKIEFEKENELQFIYGESIEEYLKNLINFTGYRNKVLGKELKIYVEIDEYGYTNYLKMDTPVNLKEKHKLRIFNAMMGIPLWKNEKKETVRARIIIISY